MKFNHTILSLLFVALWQNSWSMQPEVGLQDQDILLALAHEDINWDGKVEKIPEYPSKLINYFMSQSKGRDLCASCWDNTNYAASFDNNPFTPLPNPKKLFDYLAQKFELQQQNKKLQAAIKPGRQKQVPKQLQTLQTAATIDAQKVPALPRSVVSTIATAGTLVKVTNPKNRHQKNEELRAAIQPEHTYFVTRQQPAADEFDDWVDISENNL